MQVFTHGELFWKGAKPTQLTLTFKGASIWEGYGVLGVLSVPLPTPPNKYVASVSLAGYHKWMLVSVALCGVRWRSVWPMTFLGTGTSGLSGRAVLKRHEKSQTKLDAIRQRRVPRSQASTCNIPQAKPKQHTCSGCRKWNQEDTQDTITFPGTRTFKGES